MGVAVGPPGVCVGGIAVRVAVAAGTLVLVAVACGGIGVAEGPPGVCVGGMGVLVAVFTGVLVLAAVFTGVFVLVAEAVAVGVAAGVLPHVKFTSGPLRALRIAVVSG